MFLLHPLVWHDLQIRVLNLSLLWPATAILQYLGLKISPSHNLFLCFFFPSANSLNVAHNFFAFCRARLTNQQCALLPAMLSSSLTWSCLLLADFRVCKITSRLQKTNFYKKKKGKTTSACAHISDFFVSHSPLFPGQSCPMDCPKARELTASKPLVILPKAGQPRNLAALDTWKPHIPQLASVLNLLFPEKGIALP